MCSTKLASRWNLSSWNNCWRLSLPSFMIFRRFPVFNQICLRTPYGSDFAGMGIAGQWGLVCDVRTLSGALCIPGMLLCAMHCYNTIQYIVMYFMWYTTPRTKWGARPSYVPRWLLTRGKDSEETDWTSWSTVCGGGSFVIQSGA